MNQFGQFRHSTSHAANLLCIAVDLSEHKVQERLQNSTTFVKLQKKYPEMYAQCDHGNNIQDGHDLILTVKLGKIFAAVHDSTNSTILMNLWFL